MIALKKLEIFGSKKEEILMKHGKTQDDLDKDLKILNDWIIQEPHLPNELTEDKNLLEIFLVKNKYSIEKTKRKLDFYCSERSKYSYLYEGNFDIYSISSMYFVSEALTDDLCRVCVHIIYDEEKFDLLEDVSLVFFMRELDTRCDFNDGEIYVFDERKCSLSILKKMRMNVLADSIKLLLDVYSARLKEIHVINKWAVTLTAFFRTVLPKKIMNRVHAHEDLDSLKLAVPVKYLPKEYGGEEKSFSEFREQWDEIFKVNRDALRKAIEIKSLEDKRIEISTKDLQGTFKQLTVD